MSDEEQSEAAAWRDEWLDEVTIERRIEDDEPEDEDEDEWQLYECGVTAD